jgi:TRAP-type C4-dicarboxylate transport system permease small subunit
MLAKIFGKINAAICFFEEKSLTIIIAAMTVVIFSNVVARYVFSYSWTPTEEVGKFLMIWLTFIGLAYATRKGLNINMTAVYERLPRKLGKAVTYLISFVGVGFCFLLAYYGYLYTSAAFEGGQVTPALRVLYAWIYLPVPILLALTGIQYIRAIVKNIREKRVYSGPEEELPSEGGPDSGATRHYEL